MAVVMPKFAPLTKIVNCRKLGAEVILDGGNIGEAKQKADEIGAKGGLTYINGFDDRRLSQGRVLWALKLSRKCQSWMR